MPRFTVSGALLITPSPLTPNDAKYRGEEARKAERIRKRIERDTLEARKFLLYVAQNPGVSPEQVRKALGIHPNPGYATLEVLEYWGFIEKVTGRSSGKGRGYTKLSTTQEGQTYLQQLQENADGPQTS